MSSDNGTGGPASRSLVPGIVAACPQTPPAPRFTEAPPGSCYIPNGRCTFLVDGSPSFIHLPAPYFPTNRAGASNPGDGNISCGTGKPGTVRSTAAVRKGSAVKTLSPAASPRPQHRSPFLAGQRNLAPRLDVWGWCPRNKRRWRRRQFPVHSSAMYAICSRRPPRPRFRAAPVL
jgi:hypothetical protein